MDSIAHIKDRVRSLKALSEALRTLVDTPGSFDEAVDIPEFLEEVTGGCWKGVGRGTQSSGRSCCRRRP